MTPTHPGSTQPGPAQEAAAAAEVRRAYNRAYQRERRAQGLEPAATVERRRLAGRARGVATKRLVEAHREEFRALYEEEKRSRGLAAAD